MGRQPGTGSAGGGSGSSGSTRDVFDYTHASGDLSPAPAYGGVTSHGFDYWHVNGDAPNVESKA